MTLNLMLVSRSAVYLSGDYRLTYDPGRWKDDPNTQKLIPIFTYQWSALVSFAGVARTSRGLDVGDWVSQQLDGIEMDANFDELPRRLLTANSWLSRVDGYRPLIFSIVGFISRRPVAMVISNYSDINGHLFNPLLPHLKKFESKPNEPKVQVAEERKAVCREDIADLKMMLKENRNPREIQAAMAEANASAHDRSLTISQECVTGHLLPTGKAEVTPHGIDDRAEYLPGFVNRHYARQGSAASNSRSTRKATPCLPSGGA